MLPLAGLYDAERAVEDAPVGIDGHSDAEVIGAVVGVAIEPGAVVHVAVAGGGMCDRFRGLMYGVIVEFVEHFAVVA